MAIVCGTRPLPGVNDSGFWFVGRMSGMNPAQTLRGFSLMLTVMGFAGLLFTLIAAQVFPLK